MGRRVRLGALLLTGSGQRLLLDGHTRRIDYLRLSITDLCNLRCVYCMPEEGVTKLAHGEVLRHEELLEVVQAAAALGVSKVRVTGGEPLVRRGVVELVSRIAAIEGIETLAMTTNGVLLAAVLGDLALAGLTRINVSIDSLEPERYRAITRRGDLEKVLQGIDRAQELGLPVKINAVLLEDTSAAELLRFVRFSLERGIEVRFIEQMGFERQRDYFSAAAALEILGRQFPLVPLQPEPRSKHVSRYDCGGARIGFIAPLSSPFCCDCNKLRLTACGELRACLASCSSVDMREILRRPHSAANLCEALERAARLKPAASVWQERAEMWRIGG